MRLFFAIDFAESVKQAINDALGAIGIASPPWRWVATNNLHLTLKFLGDTQQEMLSGLETCAAAAVQGRHAFPIRVTGLGGFPNLSRPRVLFYRIEEGGDHLSHLAGRLDEELSRQLGIARDNRPFRAHVTIARIKQRLEPPVIDALRAAPDVRDGMQLVDRLVLVQSRLSPQGARYQHLKEFALTKSKC